LRRSSTLVSSKKPKARLIKSRRDTTKKEPLSKLMTRRSQPRKFKTPDSMVNTTRLSPNSLNSVTTWPLPRKDLLLSRKKSLLPLVMRRPSQDSTSMLPLMTRRSSRLKANLVKPPSSTTRELKRRS